MFQTGCHAYCWLEVELGRTVAGWIFQFFWRCLGWGILCQGVWLAHTLEVVPHRLARRGCQRFLEVELEPQTHHRTHQGQLELGPNTIWSGEVCQPAWVGWISGYRFPLAQWYTGAQASAWGQAWWWTCRFSVGWDHKPPLERQQGKRWPCHDTPLLPPQKYIQHHRSQLEASHRKYLQQTCLAASPHTWCCKMIHTQFCTPQVPDHCTPSPRVCSTSSRSRCRPAAWR